MKLTKNLAVSVSIPNVSILKNDVDSFCVPYKVA